MPSFIHEHGDPGFAEVAQQAYVQAMTEAHPAQVEDVAARIVRNAGWFKTKNGKWQQLAPDQRDKVNIRRGVPQPDGNVLVEDVDVFLPNRVKGDDEASDYTPERIKDFIANTNASAQPPAIVREHPNAARKAQGIPTPAEGIGVGFSESPRGIGWARCNLLISKPLFDEWRQGKWIGLSAGFACDKHGSNMRFGHIALLGADMQALSTLPRTEVFAADNQLCFSACPIETKGQDMPRQLTKEQREASGKLAAAHAKLSESYTMFAAGDQGADTKEAEAKTLFTSADEAMTQAFGSTDEGNPLYDEDNDTPVPVDTLLENLGEQPTAGVDVGGAPGGENQYSAADAAQFAAELGALRQTSATQQKVITALIGKQMRQEFSAFLEKKKADGHMFDSKTMMDLFSAPGVASNPEAVKNIRRVVESSPKDPKTAGGPTFSAEDAAANINQPAPAAASAEAVASAQAQLRRLLPNMTFSAEDIMLGEMIGTAANKK